jgi:glycosyltransferase involved in cell wall biosynthesis
MKKILIVSTHPALTTGYARIANVIGNYLAAQPGLEVVHFGFEKYPGTYLSDRFIDPRIQIISVVDRVDPAKDRFGTTLIKDVVEKEVKPDLVLVYNDVVVTCQMLNNFMDASRTFKVVSYLDLVYPWECVEFLKHIDRWSDQIFVFSDIWRRHLVDDFGMKPGKVRVFPHGFDSETFRPLDRAEAIERLGPLPAQHDVECLRIFPHEIIYRAFDLFISDCESERRETLCSRSSSRRERDALAWTSHLTASPRVSGVGGGAPSLVIIRTQSGTMNIT